MERIVNGQYDDPRSTRDITGILPSEYDLIIRSLQNQYKAYSAILVASEEDRIKFAELASIATGEPFDTSKLKDLSDTKVRLYIANELESVKKILSDINQPYPGAVYPG